MANSEAAVQTAQAAKGSARRTMPGCLASSSSSGRSITRGALKFAWKQVAFSTPA